MTKEFKAKVIDHFALHIDAEDGSRKTWKICFDYGAIARIEDATGIDVKRIDQWPVPSSKFPQVVWGGLRRYNPEVTLDEVLDVLNPDAQKELYDEVFFLMFPAIREEIEKQKNGLGATADPNVESATTT